jgi:hypothetical protein
MENTTTFQAVINTLPVGGQLVNENGHCGLWTGAFTFMGDSQNRRVGLVYNVDRQSVQYVNADEPTPWFQVDNSNPPHEVTLLEPNEIRSDLVLKVGERSVAAKRQMNMLDEERRDHQKFKALVQDTLHQLWDEHDGDLTDFNGEHFDDLMEALGLEGRKKPYTVTIEVKYSIEVEVEASSEEAAVEMVDEDVSSYIADGIDIGYYEDVDITATEA